MAETIEINGVTYDSVEVNGLLINGTYYKFKTTSSGGGTGEADDAGYKINFYSDGVLYASLSVTAGYYINSPQSPTKTNYSFGGWYTGENGSGSLITFPYTPTADMNIYAYWKSQTIIGFTGLTNSNGILTWTDDIENYADYTTSTSGSYVTVSGQLDSIFPYNEIEGYTDNSGNSFVKFPKMYIKWVTDSNGYVDGIKITNIETDGYFCPDCFLNPDQSGEYNDCFYMGKYEGSGSSSLVYSKSSATPLVSITRADFRTGCRAYGTSSNYYNGYQQLDMSMYTLYNFLCMLYYRKANIQTVYGGRTGQGNSTWSEASATGTTDSITTLNGWNTSTDCVKMLGVENPYGNIYKWVDGIYFSSATIYLHRYPTQYADATTNGNSIGFSRPTSSGYISYFKPGTTTSTQSSVYCYTAGGASDTYVGDYCYYSSSGTVLNVGGAWGNGTNAGLWYLNGNGAASGTNTNVGGRLCLKPL